MKTNLLFAAATLLGTIAICWMGVDFIGSNIPALVVTVVIGLVFAFGTVELLQFRAATASLGNGLCALQPAAKDQLTALLAALSPSLQGAVRRRIEGDHAGLPAPIFSPYLVGLLVMLGLLGTFIGMVDTLQGAVAALEGSTELGAVRAGLAAPIQGLGLAFGTSVAGVAASAMLGLNSTLSRRERVLVTRQLDRQIAGGALREYSLSHNRQQTYRAIQEQSEALPQVVRALADVAAQLESMGRELGEQLLDNQRQFHEQTRGQYHELAQSVDASLRESLAESGRLAGDSLAPVMETTMEKLASEAQSVQRRLCEELAGLREAEAARGAALAAQIASLQSDTAGNLHKIQLSTSDNLEGLQRTAAEVTGKLQEEVSRRIEQDNGLLEERQRILRDLATLSGSLQQSAASQDQFIAELAASATGALGRASEEFREHLSSETSRLAEITVNVAGSSAEIASLGESFALAVQLFSESNRQLIDNLSRIEQSMAASSDRSDEQMSYYVAQAREIIDHSMLSQREIIEELRRPRPTGDLLAAEVG